MKDLLIKLFQRVYVEDNDSSVNKSRGHILNAEVAVYGYTLSAELIRATSKLDEVNFLEVRRDLLESLSIISGTHVNHNTLFVDFPYSIPEQLEYLHNRIMGHVRNQMLEGEDHNYRILSCGHIISDTPFEGLEAEFGACPICQFQVEELKDTAGAKYEFKSITPLKTLYLADDEFIADKATSLLSKSSSLSADERKFVLEAVKEFKLQIPSSIYRENLPLAYTVAEGDMNKIKHLFNGATDVMRLAVFLSDADGDLSLSRNTKFRITRSASKKLLATLNDMKNLPEDMLRHREKWKRLLHALHATTAVNKRRFPNVAAAAEIVRNNGTGYETFNAKSERLTRARLINSADGLAQHLRGRPGEFVRKLDFMLLHADPDRKQEILNILVEVVDQIETGTIFNLIKHLKSRCQPGNTRIFIPKGVVTKIQTRIDEREPLDLMTVEAAVSIFEKELIKRYSLLPEIGKVFIDPIMFKQVVPFNRRGDSSTTLPISKGSRFPLGDAPVIRLFTWWKGSFDVDLSAAFYDKYFDIVDNIYYGNYENSDLGVRHSGDIQNAPSGAAEFIDFSVDKLRQNNVRYVLSHIISYRGEGFNSFPCFAGFMERDDLTSGRKFEPEAVKNKFDLVSPSSELSAHIFDLETNEVIFADLSGSNRVYNNISKSYSSLQVRLEAVLNLVNTKPTLGDVLRMHATARGKIVDTPEEADVVFDLDTLKDIDVMSEEQMKEFAIAT